MYGGEKLMFHSIRMKAQLSLKSLMGMLLGVVFLVALLPTIGQQIYNITIAANASLYSTAGLVMLGLVPLIVIAVFIISLAKRVKG
jgi:hypothetical protein